jgi:hypothetical protein
MEGSAACVYGQDFVYNQRIPAMVDTLAKSQARRALINLARKRQQAGSGSRPAFLLERTAHVRFPDLTPTLSPLRWAVIGAAATRLYMPERATNDLDLLIRAQDAATAREKLTRAGAKYQGELSIGGSSWLLPDGFSLDVIESREAWVETALAQAQTNRDAQALPVLPLPYLILMKFQASRIQDLADMTRMLGQASEEQLAAVRAVFQQWQPDGMEDLDSLIALGQLEMQ